MLDLFIRSNPDGFGVFAREDLDGEVVTHPLGRYASLEEARRAIRSLHAMRMISDLYLVVMRLRDLVFRDHLQDFGGLQAALLILEAAAERCHQSGACRPLPAEAGGGRS